jgi:hypothetical protein
MESFILKVFPKIASEAGFAPMGDISGPQWQTEVPTFTEQFPLHGVEVKATFENSLYRFVVIPVYEKGSLRQLLNVQTIPEQKLSADVCMIVIGCSFLIRFS